MIRIIEQFHNLNIFSKMIIILLFVIIIPVMISFYMSLGTTQDLITKQMIKDSKNSVMLVSENIEELLTATAQLMLYTSTESRIVNYLKKYHSEDGLRGEVGLEAIKYIENVLQGIAFRNFPINEANISLISKSGIMYANFQSRNNTAEDFLKKNYVNEQVVLNNYIIWRGLEENYVLNNQQSYPKVITSVKAIKDNQSGTTYGTLVISLHEDVFRRIISYESEGVTRVLLDKHMNVISASNSEWTGKSMNDFFEEPSFGNETGYLISSDRSGQKNILTYKKLYRTEWIFIEIRSYSSIKKTLDHITYRHFFINIVCVALFALLASIVVRSITNPLRKLSEMMDRTDLELQDSFISDSESTDNELKVLENSYNKMKRNIIRLIEDNSDKEKKKREAELQALQSQISPHFLFNTLNAIRWCILSNKGKNAAEMLLSLTKLLDATISRGEELISLKHEIDIVLNYVDILKFRQYIEFEVRVALDKKLENYLIPRLLLQPIVENAIFHGFENMREGGVIEIFTEIKGKYFVIAVKDNGKGMDISSEIEKTNNKSYKFTGIGVGNVDERVKLHYGNEYGLHIESAVDQGTLVKILLPMLTEASESE